MNTAQDPPEPKRDRMWSPWRALQRSFAAKVVMVCLLATVTALTVSFGAFQWQDWSSDIEYLKDDQV